MRFIALVAAFAGCTTGVEVGAERAASTPPDAGLSDVSRTDARDEPDSPPPRPCVPVACQNQPYACGDCKDNDGDGRVDMDDPECVGPCDNSELSFFGSIPGQNRMMCEQDCYFDQDSGLGNDRCTWSHVCDPKSVAPDFSPQGPECAYDPDALVSGPGGPQTCDSITEQPAQCLDVCGPLVPNGCDCFGCCEFPGGRTIWLGSQDEAANGTCTSETLDDPTRCRPCTQVRSCLNPCEECELCVGKRRLPSSCGGAPDRDGTACPVPECPADYLPCGTECLPDCPPGQACLTGCCVKAPQ